MVSHHGSPTIASLPQGRLYLFRAPHNGRAGVASTADDEPEDDEEDEGEEAGEDADESLAAGPWGGAPRRTGGERDGAGSESLSSTLGLGSPCAGGAQSECLAHRLHPAGTGRPQSSSPTSVRQPRLPPPAWLIATAPRPSDRDCGGTRSGEPRPDGDPASADESAPDDVADSSAARLARRLTDAADREPLVRAGGPAGENISGVSENGAACGSSAGAGTGARDLGDGREPCGGVVGREGVCNAC